MNRPRLQITMPIGGSGKGFADHGYTFPKPLVEVNDKPMIEVVINNLMPTEDHEFVFCVRKEHIQRYAMTDMLQLISPGCRVVQMEGDTGGALCSVLLAIDCLDRDAELLIVNSDQVVDARIDDFLSRARAGNWDGYIMTFPSTHPKWSFAKEEEGQVVAVAEKRPISNNATSGLYYFKSAGLFLEAAEKTILKNATVQGEFYVCPVYNEMILMGRRIGLYKIEADQMHSLGTPEDVQRYARLRQPGVATSYGYAAE
jgi:NDP-sugar pyrophosphorylase family protein